jgi:excisionase family DNA binding protein
VRFDPKVGRGLTVPELAKLLRVGQDKVRGWIRRGELAATDTGTAGRPRLVILPSALAEFERSHRAGRAPPRPPPRPLRAKGRDRDYYPGPDP